MQHITPALFSTSTAAALDRRDHCVIRYTISARARYSYQSMIAQDWSRVGKPGRSLDRLRDPPAKDPRRGNVPDRRYERMTSSCVLACHFPAELLMSRIRARAVNRTKGKLRESGSWKEEGESERKGEDGRCQVVTVERSRPRERPAPRVLCIQMPFP